MVLNKLYVVDYVFIGGHDMQLCVSIQQQPVLINGQGFAQLVAVGCERLVSIHYCDLYIYIYIYICINEANLFCFCCFFVFYD